MGFQAKMVNEEKEEIPPNPLSKPMCCCLTVYLASNRRVKREKIVRERIITKPPHFILPFFPSFTPFQFAIHLILFNTISPHFLSLLSPSRFLEFASISNHYINTLGCVFVCCLKFGFCNSK